MIKHIDKILRQTLAEYGLDKDKIECIVLSVNLKLIGDKLHRQTQESIEYRNAMKEHYNV